jgi:alkylation response protein AidB-like acyl-CoA dehydrogenase
VNLELTDDQVQLRDELRRFLADRLPTGTLLAQASHPGAVDRGLWRELAEMGVFSLTLSEASGGLGLGRAEAVVVFEELGRACVPGPLVPTFLAAGLVDGAASGEFVVGGLLDSPEPVIEHLDALDGVLAFDVEGVRLVDPPSGTAFLRPLDPLSPVHRTAPLGSGRRLAGFEVAAVMRRDADLLVAALQVGLGEAAVVMATEYAKSRMQFGRVIGGFQSIKHLLADAAVWIDVARAAVHAAAVEVDELSAGPGLGFDGHTCSVASARIVASSAANRATATAIQVHGGMGYTWELEAHLFLKRVAVLDNTLGSPDDSLDHRASELLVAVRLG